MSEEQQQSQETQQEQPKKRITVKQILEDLEAGLTRSEIGQKYELIAREVKQLFEHPKLKGKKAKKKTDLSFQLVDDLEDDEQQEVTNETTTDTTDTTKDVSTDTVEDSNATFAAQVESQTVQATQSVQASQTTESSNDTTDIGNVDPNQQQLRFQ